MLTTDNHRRDVAGLTYVYPVVSRRAGGVSVGINLNTNHACNWACIYCQVEDLQRGGPPPIDVALLGRELDMFLGELLEGDFMTHEVPPEARRLVDVAFSGNGEPTSAAEFEQAVGVVLAVLARRELSGAIPLRLITNGSLLHRPGVQAGIERLGRAGGEVWFKLDRVGRASQLVNGVPWRGKAVQANLARCATLARTWVQTCWFALDGALPLVAEEDAYCALLNPLASQLAGVHLYGLARPSCQPEADRLQRADQTTMEAFAEKIKRVTGLAVQVSP